MRKNIDFNFISNALKFGVEKKYKVADMAFEGFDGNLTEEMKAIAEDKNANSIFSFESEVVGICEPMAGVPFVVTGNVYSKGLFGWEDGFCERMTLLLYVHENGIQKLSIPCKEIEADNILNSINNADRFLDDDGFMDEKEEELCLFQ